MDEDWEEVAERDYLESDDEEEWANSLIKTDLAAVRARPNGLSKLDKSYYKIRFKYAVGSRKAYKEGNKSRPFCKSMMARTSQGIVYKLEDINKASKVAFEKAAKLPMHKGQPYSLFKFKGGVYCRHKWVQVLYKIKKSSLKEGKKGSKNLDDYKRVKDIPASAKSRPKGIKDSVIAPVNMPNQGHYPGVK